MTSSPSRSPVRSVTTATTIDRRQAVLDQAAQQPVLAQGEVVGQLLDDVGRAVAVVAQLDEPHDVAVQPEHAVHVRQVPVVEVGGERQGRRGAGGRPDRRAAVASPALGRLRGRLPLP